jgi:exonuclease VII small subunit
MGDSIDLGLGVTTQWGPDITGVQSQQQGPAPIKDSMTTYTGETNNEAYKSPVDKPQIPPPIPGADPTGMETLTDILKNFPDQVLAAADQIPAADSKFETDASELVSNLSDSELSEAGDGKPPELVKTMVEYGILHPDADLPPGIKAISEKISQQASQESGGELNPVVVAISDKAMDLSFQASIQGQLLNSGLSAEDQAKLNAAFQNPDFVSSLPPELQTIMKSMVSKAFAEVQEGFGMPDNFQFPSDAAGFDTKASTSVEKGVSSKIANMLQQGQLSPADAKALRTILYLGTSSAPNNAQLTSMLQDIRNAATKQVQKEIGFPTGYEPQIDGTVYDSILTGAYYNNIKKGISSQSPALSSADAASLMAAVGSPAAREKLSPELKAILSKIEGTALAKVSSQYSLPAGWKPNETMLAGAAERTSTTEFKVLQNVVSTGIEYVNNAKSLATPDNLNAAFSANTGTTISDYLKVVSAALGALQEVLFSKSMLEANLAHTEANIQLDASMGEVKRRHDDLIKVEKQEKKEASMGPFKFIMELVLLIILTMFMGPFGVMLWIALFVNTMVQEKGDISKTDMFGDFSKLMGEIGQAIGGPTVAKAFQVLACNPFFMLLDFLTGNGTLLSNGLQALGVSKAVAGYISMGVQVAVTIIIAILVTVLTFGAGAEVGVGMIAEALGSMAARVATTTAQMGSKVGEFAGKVIEQTAKMLEKIAGPFANSNGYMGDGVKMAADFTRAVLKELKSFTDGAKKSEEAVMKFKDVADKAEKLVKNAEAELAKAEKQLDFIKDLTGVKNALTKAIEKTADLAVKQVSKEWRQVVDQITERVTKIFKDFDEAKDNLNTLSKQLEQAEKNVVKTQEKIAEASAKGVSKSEMKDLEKAAKNAKEAVTELKQHVAQAEGRVESLTRLLESEKQALKNAFEDAIRATDDPDIQSAFSNLQHDTETVFNKMFEVGEKRRFLASAKSDFEIALGEFQEKLMDATLPLAKFANASQLIFGIAQASVSVNNNLVKAQIALIQGALEKYITEVEEFIKILQKLINKLLDEIAEMGKYLAQLGQVIQSMYQQAEQSFSKMAAA